MTTTQGAITAFRGKQHAFLSNFHYGPPIHLDGQAYPTVEHAFQAAKTDKPHERAKVRDASTPGLAKRAGRRVTLRPDWEQAKVRVMLGLLREKFAAGTDLAAQLLATGEVDLIESNTWHDTFWGVDAKTGKGRNELGHLLRLIRHELRMRGES